MSFSKPKVEVSPNISKALFARNRCLHKIRVERCNRNREWIVCCGTVWKPESQEFSVFLRDCSIAHSQLIFWLFLRRKRRPPEAKSNSEGVIFDLAAPRLFRR